MRHGPSDELRIPLIKEGVHYIALEEYRGMNSTDGLNQTELGWCFSKPWSHIRDLGQRYGFITGNWSSNAS